MSTLVLADGDRADAALVPLLGEGDVVCGPLCQATICDQPHRFGN